MEEAHKSNFAIHLGISKMYQDLEKMFWWPEMKKDIAEMVRRCLVCQKVKIEHQKPSSMFRPLEIPKWKWEGISIDFMTRLPRTKAKYDAIWVIMDRLTKYAHFLPLE